MPTNTHNQSEKRFLTPFLRPQRRGISLVEVLISMGILALGLLGVAAIFPVGGHYVQAGDTYDSADAVAQAALADAAARGWLDPKNWVGLRVDLSPANARNRFTDDFDVKLRARMAAATGNLPNDERMNALFVGNAFVIDVLGAASMQNRATGAGAPMALIPTMGSSPSAAYFPASAPVGAASTFNAVGAATSTIATWYPWANAGSGWPVRRLTVEAPDNDNVGPVYGTTSGVNFPRYPMPLRTAESICISSDDLALEVPEDAARPIQQRFTGLNGAAMQRQSKGEFSWLLTVAPSSNTERNALALDPGAFDYEVSAVVFRGRQLGDVDQMRAAERVVSARVITRGVGGGELLLERTPTTVNGEPAEDPFLLLRTGQYVMLVGPRPGSTPAAPAVFLAWYRVTAIEVPNSAAPIGGLTPNPLTQRIVSLRGPDWPWFPGTPLNLANTSVLSNDLRVGIFPGAVGVHTRTMRLTSGTAWGE